MFIKNIEREVFLKAFQRVIGIVERKQPLPILSNVLIRKTDSTISFVATDLEIQIESHTEFDEATDNNSITVSAKKLQEIIRVLPEKSLFSLDIQENKLILKSNKSRFNLQTLPAQDFPLVSDQLKESSVVIIKQAVLKKLLANVQYSMAQQDIRYYLNGVLLVLDTDYIKLIATDGHRLAFASAKFQGLDKKHEIIISRKTVIELSKLLSDSEGDVKLELAEKQIKISLPEVTLTSKIIDGKFPDYDRVIPKYSNTLILDRLILSNSLQRVAVLSNEKFRGVRFILTEKNLKIISSNNEQEEAQEEIENEYHGPALDIGFNVNYLLDGINNLESELVMLSFGDANSSILISIPQSDDFKYVVMPMRI
jgi:DNA polymerase-3 subunit beta